jgi:branched-chain amino acid transport system permease protein
MMRMLVPAAIAAISLAIPPVLGEGYLIQVLNIALLNAIVVLGLNFVTGWTGQINFGQAAFYGLGAYTTGIATLAGLPWLAAPFLSALVAAIASLILGVPTLRLRSYYLAMTTIGFGEIVRLILIHWESVTGGSSGLRAIPPISVLGLPIDTQARSFYLLALMLALAALLAARIRNSSFGRAMIATRDSEISAELSGVDTIRIKILAFALGAVYAGVAGCLFASTIRYISPDSFTNTQAVLLLTMLIIGGTGSIPGAIVGAIGLTLLPEALRFLGQWYLVLYGVGVIAVITFAPGGLAAAAPALLRRLGLAR